MRKFILILTATLFAGVAVCAQDKVTKKVLELGRTDNRTMQHAEYIARNIGGRLVGTHMLNHAEDWVAEQFRSWGLEVTVQEAVEIGVGFDRGPWSGRMLSEDGMTLHFGTPAYTAGTCGPQKGRVLIEPKNEREFERVKGALKGAWVLLETGPTNGLALDASAAADSARAAQLAGGVVLNFHAAAGALLNHSAEIQSGFARDGVCCISISKTQNDRFDGFCCGRFGCRSLRRGRCGRCGGLCCRLTAGNQSKHHGKCQEERQDFFHVTYSFIFYLMMGAFLLSTDYILLGYFLFPILMLEQNKM